jgi:hypothetical protein
MVVVTVRDCLMSLRPVCSDWIVWTCILSYRRRVVRRRTLPRRTHEGSASQNRPDYRLQR